MQFTYRDMSFTLEDDGNNYLLIRLGLTAYSVPLKYEIKKYLNDRVNHSQIYFMIIKKLLEFNIIRSSEREIRMAMVDEYIGYEPPTKRNSVDTDKNSLQKRDAYSELQKSFWGNLIVLDCLKSLES